MLKLEIYPTKDQSYTLYNPELDETYHSRNGAIEESMHVFITAGLHQALATKPAQLHLLEIGFGTGLNAILTLEQALKHQVQICYHALETFPLPNSIIEQLQYDKLLHPSLHNFFELMHTCRWDTPQVIAPYFELTKIHQPLQEFGTKNLYDLIYFDAFAPDKQPQMWTHEAMTICYDTLKPGGLWVTYSSKGDVKRALKNVGFEVERLPGPPLKRHMLRASKPLHNDHV